MAAMVAGMAAADPSVEFGNVTVGGSAQTTWGVDLDDGETGFKNDASVTFKVSFLSSGTKSTEGEDIWAELGVGVGNTGNWTNNPIVNVDGKAVDNANDYGLDGTVSVGITTAKIHLYNFYVGLLSGDTQVGELKIDSAIRSNDSGNGKWLDNVGKSKHHGLVLGYGDNKNFGFDLDFRSNPKNEGTEADPAYDYYVNDYGIAAEAKLLDSNELLNGLFLDLGGSYAFTDKILGLAAQAAFKASINDTFYVRPVVGYTFETTTPLDADKVKSNNTIAGGILLGWGDTADANAGVYYLDNDNAKKVTPGFGVVAYLPLDGKKLPAGAQNMYVQGLELVPSFFTGSTLIPGLTAAAYADIVIPFNVRGDTGKWQSWADAREGSDVDAVLFGIAGGLKYDLKATDSVTVTPGAGIRYANKTYNMVFKDADGKNATQVGQGAALFGKNGDNGNGADNVNAEADGLLNVKVGVDVSGLLNNTTFGVNWQSRNLLNTADDAKKAGTLNVYAKISF